MLFILQKIDDDYTHPQELEHLWEGDEAAGKGYLLFLRDMGWIMEEMGRMYKVTEKGKANLEKLSESLPILFKKNHEERLNRLDIY